MKLLGHVQCHLCILKQFCEFEQSELSYKWEHYDKYYDSFDSFLENEKTEWLDIATANCPIKRMIEKKEEEKAKP
jgi:hypothetical protein